MTAVYADARPPGVDVPFRPGNTLTVELTWPAGALVGRTFVSTLAGTSLPLAVLGDVMTIEATEAQTAAVDAPAEWLLTETTGGASNDLLIGTWSPSMRPGTATTVGPVVLDDVDVQVGGAALVDHAADANLHRGGQHLATAHITQNHTNTTPTFTDIPGGAVTFKVPPSGRYMVEAAVLAQGSAAGVHAVVRITDGAGTSLVNDRFRATGIDDRGFLRLGLRYPTPLFVHPALGPGDTITYKLQLAREAAVGTASLFVEAFTLVVAENWLQAVALSP